MEGMTDKFTSDEEGKESTPPPPIEVNRKKSKN